MPDPLVVTQANRFRAALLRREAAQQAEMTRRWVMVERALEEGIADTIREIDWLRAGGEVFGRNPDPYMQLDRYQDLLAQTQRELARYATYAERQIATGMAEHAALGATNGAAAIDAIMSEANLFASFNRLSAAAVESLAATLADDAAVGQLLRQAFPDAAVRMTEALIEGIALGWNPTRTAMAMTEGLQAGALQRALVIARTEQLRAYRTATLEGYRQSGIIKGYRRHAAKSDRTCLACLMADGTFYETTESFEEHPNGRCALIPVLRVGPDPTWQHGREWFEAQPATTQRSIMGPGAFNAWQDGAVTLEELVTRHEHPVWGGSLVQRPLRDAIGAEAAQAYARSAFYSQDNARAAVSVKTAEGKPKQQVVAKVPHVIGDVHPDIKQAWIDEFSSVNQDFPFMEDWVTALDGSGKEGISSDWDSFTNSVRMGKSSAKLSEAQFNSLHKTDPDAFVGGYTLRRLLTHELGHGVDSYVTIGLGRMSDLQEEYINALRRIQAELPIPSKYAGRNNKEWFAEQFSKERMEGEGPLHAVLGQYVPQVERGFIDEFLRDQKKIGR